MKALSNGSEEYLSWLSVERGRSPNTLAAYRRDLAAYEARLALGMKSPTDADPGDVEAHLWALERERAGPATVARAFSAIRGLHRFLFDEGRARVDPTADLDSIPVPGRLPKALSEEEVMSLLASPGGDRPADRRDRALLELLYGTGARISEVVGLDLTDLTDLTDPAGRPGKATGSTGLLRLEGKGSRQRLVPLGGCAESALGAWLSAEGRGQMLPKQWRRRGDAEAVFLNARGGRLSRQGAYEIVRRRAAAAGIDRQLGPHVLRHSCATHMLEHGADIRVVQELLGHVSITTTQMYTKVTTEHLRAVYEQAHPRSGRVAPATALRRQEGGLPEQEGSVRASRL